MQGSSLKQPELFFEIYLPEKKEMISAKEFGAILNIGSTTVRNLIDEGKLFAFTFNASAPKGKEQRSAYRIPRHAALMFLLESCTWPPDLILEKLLELIDGLTPEAKQVIFKTLK